MTLALLARRRFGPLFAVQYLGAFNDNLFKTAMLFLVTYRLLAGDPQASAGLVTVAAGLFILPFFLFSGLAGQIADAFDKARLVRIIKLAEIFIMLGGAAAILLGSIPLMLAMLFATGTQSAFFGPIKYSILPQYLAPREVMGGTGLIEAGTFIAILTGQIAGGLIGAGAAALCIVIVALVGYAASLALPPAPPAPGAHRIERNIAASGYHVVKGVLADRRLARAVIAISWFWSVGAVFTSLFVPLVRATLGGAESVATLFLVAFSVGVALGSLAIGRVLKGAVSVRYLPVSAILMTLFIADLYFAVGAYPAAPGGGLVGVAAFLERPAAWRVLIDLTGMAAAAGTFIVPLYALLQTASDPAARARVIAANNIVNSGFMVAAALGSGALISAGLSVPEVLLAVGGLNLLILVPCTALVRIERRATPC